jgi:hypothetical protein
MFVQAKGDPYLTAVSGVEMALWDLAGKALELPIHRLMGGKMRERVPVYLHAANPAIARRIFAETKTRVAKVGLDYSNDDFSIRKGYEPDRPYHLHMTNAQIDDVVNFFATFRKELGNGYEFGLELHAHYDLETVCRSATRWSPTARYLSRSRCPVTMSSPCCASETTLACPSPRARISTPLWLPPFLRSRPCPSSNRISARPADEEGSYRARRKLNVRWAPA